MMIKSFGSKRICQNRDERYNSKQRVKGGRTTSSTIALVIGHKHTTFFTLNNYSHIKNNFIDGKRAYMGGLI